MLALLVIACTFTYSLMLCILGIDSSLPALELAEENANLNNIISSRIYFLKEDATKFMKSTISKEKPWDLDILDPPKLAPSRKVCKLFRVLQWGK